MDSPSDHNILKWAIGLIMAVVSWIWVRLNRVINRADSAYDKASESRLVLAERHYTKLEVDHLVEKSIKPIHDKLDTMSDDLKFLVREKRREDS